jgi:hypothetical protein
MEVYISKLGIRDKASPYLLGLGLTQSSLGSYLLGFSCARSLPY